MTFTSQLNENSSIINVIVSHSHQPLAFYDGRNSYLLLNLNITRYSNKLFIFLLDGRFMLQDGTKHIATLWQQGIWIDHCLNSENDTYNLSLAIKIKGLLNVDIIKNVLTDYVHKFHLDCNSFFYYQDEKLYQEFLFNCSINLKIFDLEDLENPQAEFEKIRNHFEREPFNITERPLYRFCLVKISAQEYYLVLVFHHIIADGLTLRYAIQKISELYNQYPINCSSTSLEKYAVSAQFSAHQDKSDKIYWSELLKEYDLTVNFSLNRKAQLTNNIGHSIYFKMDTKLTNKLLNFIHDIDVSLFVFLTSIYALALSLYTWQEKFIITYAANMRVRKQELKPGCYINTLCFGLDISQNCQIIEFIKQLKKQRQQTKMHAGYPLFKIANDFRKNKVHLNNQWFNAHIVDTYTEQLTPVLRDLEAEILNKAQRSLPHQICLAYEKIADSFSFRLDYQNQIFDYQDAINFKNLFLHLIEESLEKNHSIYSLPSLNLSSKNTLKAMQRVPIHSTVTSLFEQQVRLNPDDTAIVYEGKSLSYSALNQQANQLAYYLQTHYQIGPEILVGLSVERGLLLVIGLLGILKAGGVYVPLDPSYPQKRLNYMLKDANIQLLLTAKSLRALYADFDGNYLELDGPWQQLNLPEKNVQNTCHPNHLAYVIYTSGSTGQPKGVMNIHAGLSNRLAWMKQYFNINQQSRILHKTPIGFDISLWELLLPLIAGGQLYVLEPEHHKDPTLVARYLSDFKISHVHFVPTMLEAFLSIDSNLLTNLALKIISSGEALPVNLIKRMTVVASNVQIYNLYGPTEASIDVSYHAVKPKELEEFEYDTVPIGLPLWNTMLYVLDKHRRLAPIGVPGELYIGGMNLARGYLNQPELTHERFIENPFLNSEERKHYQIEGIDTRLYQTGDLVKYLPDGQLLYLGRLDEQVKLRGFRIELTEIAHALTQIKGIEQAAVLLQAVRQQKSLVAYYTLKPNTKPLATNDLRAALSLVLPSYMVPAYYLLLTHWPLTVNGKLDKQQLPLPKEEQKATTALPQNKFEQTLWEIWCKVLQRSSIGVEDNLFELGGDSIQSIQIVAQAQRFGIEISVKQLFDHPTIRSLSYQVQLLAKQHELIASPEQEILEGEAPLSPIQKWFFDLELPQESFYNQAQWYRVSQPLNLQGLKAMLAALVEQHDVLRFEYRQINGFWHQKYGKVMPEAVICEEKYLPKLSKTERETQLVALASRLQQGLNLQIGPLGRALLVNLEDGSQYVFLVFHHTVIDGVSWRIIGEDLNELFSQWQAKKILNLGKKTHSYRAWCRALLNYRQHILATKLKPVLKYWLKQTTKLTANKTTQLEKNIFVNYHAELDSTQSRYLLRDCHRAYHTRINDLLLTALMLSLRKYCGSELAILLEGHGRETELLPGYDLSRTVGWFTSLFPLVLKLTNESLGSQIKQIKEQLRNIPDKGLSYGVLRYLGNDKIANRLQDNDSPKIVFNYLGQIDSYANSESMFKPEGLPIGLCTAIENLPALGEGLTLNAEVRAGSFQFYWHYSGTQYSANDIKTLADDYLHNLQQIIDHCFRKKDLGFTPSDFPLTKLNQVKLDRLLTVHSKVEDIYPLSSMQSGFVFQSLYAPQSDRYLVQGIQHLSGLLDEKIYRAAWEAVIHHYPALRTGFILEDEQNLLQYVKKAVDLPWIYLDLSAVSDEQQELRWHELVLSDRQKPFRLETAPLLRVHLVRFSQDSYRVLWCIHHSLTDGWSLSLLNQSLRIAYHCLHQNKPIYFAYSRPYRDYMGWLLTQNQLDVEVWWRNYLAQLSEPSLLSDVYKKTKTFDESTIDYCVYKRMLSTDQTRSLVEFARKENLTLHTVLQGCIGWVLTRYLGHEQVVLGVTTSGRDINFPGVETIFGSLIQTIPFILKFDDNENFLVNLKRQQAEFREVSERSFVSLAKLQSIAREKEIEQLFDVLYAFENYPTLENEQAFDLPYRINRSYGIERTEYPLSIVVMPGECLAFNFCYESNYYDELMVQQLADHLIRSLQLVLAKEKSLKDLSLLSDQERYRQLVTWNSTRKDYPRNKTVMTLFEEQVQLNPDNIAIIYEGKNLSYSDLNKQANQLGHYLQTYYRVGPEILVGLSVERSLLLIVGILGILKAGGAYVPLDPTYPKARLQYMLRDAGIQLLLTTQSLRTLFEEFEGDCLELDGPWRQLELSTDNVQNACQPNNLVYVIYTSGSTGQPKGVMIENTSLVNYLLWLKLQFKIPGLDRILLKTSFSFDASVWEIFLPIVSGKTAVVCPLNVEGNPDQLTVFINQYKITVIQFVPSFLAFFLQHVEPNSMPSLKYVISGGEYLSNDLSQLFFSKLNVELINLYGPTETTIDATSYTCTHASASITLGRPIWNTTLYVLDKHRQIVPIGVPGELYIGGVSIARGYLNRPELTHERFIENPFLSSEERRRYQVEGIDTRLYRTGDLVKYLPDGQLLYLGRLDEQVKLRGYRIELTEIVHALMQIESIEQAVVLLQEVRQQKSLVTYYNLKPNTKPLEVNELRAHLSARLPNYMVPAYYLLLTHWPLTVNGKLDKRQLPLPEEQQTIVASLPQNQLEQTLSEIWCKVLQRSFVGVKDNFFELGGDSLLLIQLYFNIKKRLGQQIEFKKLFTQPTIRQQSQLLKLAGTAKNFSYALSPEYQRPSFIPLSYSQQRLWFIEYLAQVPHLYHIQIAYDLKNMCNVFALKQSLLYLVERHEILRTVICELPEGTGQIVVPGFPIEQIFKLHEVENLTAKDFTQSENDIMQQPFDFANGPLFRVVLFVEQQRSIFRIYFVFHHLIMDGASLGVFLTELSQAYEAYLANREPILEKVALQYADYAMLQRTKIQKGKASQHLNYWLGLLSDSPESINLATDRSRPETLSYEGGVYEVELAQEQFQQLNLLVKDTNTTLFMVLLSLWQFLLHKYSSQDEVIVGTPIAGSMQHGVENALGLFINTLALKSTLNLKLSFKQFLQTVKEACLLAYEHQEAPFDFIVDHLKVKRCQNKNPIFQVMFLFENFSDNNQLFFDVESLRTDNLPTNGAKVDLTLYAVVKQKRLYLKFEYTRDLFDTSSIERLSANFLNLIKIILINPDRPLAKIEFLSQAERYQQLTVWNATHKYSKQNKTMVALFEEQAELNPDEIAVIYDGKSLSYSALNKHANRLAHYLQTHYDVGLESLVGLSIERSLSLIIGLLGILKAGGVYVPLDPSYPWARLNYMLEDAHIQLLLTTQSLRTRFDNFKGECLELDGSWCQLKLSETNIQNVSRLNHLAYVIYTSGSTGKPKGVMNIHAGLSNHLLWMKNYFAIDQQARILHKTTINFDVSLWELLLPLIAGGQLHLLKPGDHKDPILVANYLHDFKITHVHFVPTMLEAFSNIDLNLLNRLSTKIISIGEALPVSLTKHLGTVAKNIQIYNMYGPTEASIVVSYQAINPKEFEKFAYSTVPIGRPIWNIFFYVLDKNKHLVPIGVPGELYISGVGLARGYLNRPELTCERFIENPFLSPEEQQRYQTEELDTRLYQTGDLVKYLSDGRLLYLGRLDEQIKLRGYRIELAEISHTLEQISGIEQAVVMVQEVNQQKNLVAYYSLKPNRSQYEISELRAALSHVLPDYMVPYYYLLLTQWPMTANGKLDRRQLPLPEEDQVVSRTKISLPQTKIEQTLWEIWREVLKLSSFGIDDNLFELGGDSIQSVQIVSRAQRRGIEISVKQVFDHPTIRSISYQAQLKNFKQIEASSDESHKTPFALAGLSQEKLANLLAAHDGIEDIYPLSSMQAGFMFQNLYAPKSDRYLVQGIQYLTGPVDEKIYQSAWKALIKHYSLLRTGFILDDEENLLQYVKKTVDLPWVYLDLRQLSAESQESRWQEIVLADRQNLYCLEKAPLFRVYLLRFDRESYRVLWSIHHSLVDGWSMALISHSLSLTYACLNRSIPIHLDYSRPYRDYISWLLTQNQLEAEAWWRDYLAQLNEASLLSEIYKRAKTRSKSTADYSLYEVALSTEQTEALLKFAREQSLTLHTVLQGCIGWVLSRYLGNKQMVLGVTMSGRDINLLGVESIAGILIQTVPFIMNFDDNENFTANLKRQQLEFRAVSERSFVSLAKLQSIARDKGIEKLFDVFYVFENYPTSDQPLDLPYHVSRSYGIERTEYPLSIMVIPGKNLMIRFSYETNCYSESMVRQLCKHIVTSFNLVLTEQKSLQHLTFLSESERYQQLVTWNSTHKKYPQHKMFVALFEEQVQLNPDKIAVVYENESLTYSALNKFANRLGHYLQAHYHVGPEVLVGLSVERSLLLLVGLLGIFKSGGVYVPLDPSYPPARLQYMLKDAGVKLLLTTQTLRTFFEEFEGDCLQLDGAWRQLTLPEENVQNITEPNHLAYVLYTSGSTGQPKGTMNVHSGLCNRLLWMKNYFEINQTSRFLHKTPIGFDVSIWELLQTLIAGGKLYILPPEMHKDPTAVAKYLDDFKITHVHFVASMLDAFLSIDSTLLNRFSAKVISSGEAVPSSLIKRASIMAKGMQIYNLYGTTETSIEVACKLADPDELKNCAYSTVSMGRPIWNTFFYVLDKHLRLVPIGVPGELYIGGVSIARGYLNRPELTHERFIENLFLTSEERKRYQVEGIDTRLYQTGDLVKYLSDGELLYLSRLDEQIKLRGFRIELAEIAYNLEQVPGVEQAVVLLQEVRQQKNLVAYYSLKPNSKSLEINELRDALSTVLPSHMVPTYYLLLTHWPLTTNGKLNKRQLPLPKEEQKSATSLPQNKLEQTLAEIWCKVLQLSFIGVEDNFFELGGDSLLLIQLYFNIKKRLGQQIEFKKLFTQPTIRQQSQLLKLAGTSNDLGYVLSTEYERPNFIPLSYSQQRLWFIEYLSQVPHLYHIQIAYDLKTLCNVFALKQSLLYLVERHEILRTVIRELPEGTGQVVVPGFSIDQLFKLHEVENLTATDFSELEKYIMQQPFDFANGPLFRVVLFVEQQRSIFRIYFVFHHLIMDGASLGVFLTELSQAYEAYLDEREPILEKVALQYPDYTLLQRTKIQKDKASQHLNYWLELLSDSPESINLATDRSRPETLSYEGNVHQIELAQEQFLQLTQLAKDTNTTLFMILLSLWQFLLHKYSLQDEVIVGTPITGSMQHGVENALGLFINTLALKSTFNSKLSFKQFLQTVKESCLLAYEHQEIPFDFIVDQLKIKRCQNQNPIFQVMFLLEGYARDNQLLLNVESTCIENLPTNVAKVDLTLYALPNKNGLSFRFEYMRDLFDASSIERLSANFINLIEAILRNPESPLAEIEFLSETERYQQLIVWNQTHKNYSQNKTIVTLFEEQVELNPNRIAVIYEDENLSYSTLNKQANRLGHYLQTHYQVGPEVLVGLSVERGPWMIVGLLGILKAGGAYVPLDPSYPLARLKYMLKDASIKLLLTTQSLRTLFEDFEGDCLELDGSWCQLKLSEQNIQNTSKPNNLAYVIYTSGSTGQPKGVMIENASLVNHMLWMKAEYKPEITDRVLQKTSFSFDAAMWEILFPLTTGITLVLCPSNKAKDPEKLIEIINHYKITIIQFVPSFLALLLQQINNQLMSSLKYVMSGGENLSSNLRIEFYKKIHASLQNLYGPTETTIEALFYACSSAEKGTTPIGRPIGNAVLYVLDNNCHLVPIGVPGELYIGGACLARGYLNQPELTRDRFIENPFFTSEERKCYQIEGRDTRLYQTGDLVKYLPDGNLLYLGRVDEQVKLRGYRIELAEIEQALEQIPSIKQAVVVLQTIRQQKTLVAYYDLKPDTRQFEVSELRMALLRVLPDYMVPSFYILLTHWPITANGKLDKRQLPLPEETLKDSISLPQTKLEQTLWEVWCKVLQLSSISVEDNFFELGGDSIQSIQIVSQARRFGIEISVKQLFDHPTIRSLSYQAQMIRVEDESAEFEIKAPFVLSGLSQTKLNNLLATYKDTEDIYPLSSMQSGFVFQSLYAPKSDRYLVQGIQHLSGLLDGKIYRAAWEAVINHYPVLRTGFILEDEQNLLQYVKKSVDLPWTYLDLSEFSGEQQQARWHKLVLTDRQKPFRLETAPLFRIHLVRFTPDSYRVLWSIHHSLTDGWSMPLLNQSLRLAYHCLHQNQPIHFAYSRPYRDYIGWLLAQNKLEAETWWQNYLAQLSEPSLLNDVYKRTQAPHESIADYCVYERRLSTEQTKILAMFAREENLTLHTVLQGCIGWVLSRYLGHDQVVLGVTTSGRDINFLGVETIFGSLIQTIPFILKFDDNESFVINLKRQQAEFRQVSERGFVSLAKLQSIAREKGIKQLFDVLYAFENYPTLDNEQAFDLPYHVNRSYGIERTEYPLSIVVMPGECLAFSFCYEANYYDELMVQQLADHLVRSLQLVLTKETSLKELNLLSEQERYQQLVTWNSTRKDYPRNKTLMTLFEEQVQLNPDKIAVIHEGKSLSYSALNIEANRLGHYLQTHYQVEPEILVGLSVERSLLLIIGMLGILKAGGAYVPLDPTYPKTRLQYMLRDAGIRLLLTTQSLRTLFEKFEGDYLELDGSWQQLELPTGNVQSTCQPNNLAYIIYTSGSTGQPKGVMITQKNIISLVKNTHFLTITEKDHIAHISNISFDASILEVWGGLLNSAQVCMLSKQDLLNPEKFRNFLLDNKITILWLTTSFFNQKIKENIHTFSFIKNLIIGGEALDPDSINECLNASNKPEMFINGYGPTENTTFSTIYRIEQAKYEGSIPIGKPITNKQAYVLDAKLRLKPCNTIGELYVGGEGLARGYLNQPELTAEKFIENPFLSSEERKNSQAEGYDLRLYRTGDLVKYLPDGNLIYVGRIDDQVKLRGYRIELNEIAQALQRHIEIKQATVLLQETRSEKNLIAFYSLKDESNPPQVTELHTHLVKLLPEYMIPSNYFLVSKMPLTAHGKLDRKQLLKLSHHHKLTKGNYFSQGILEYIMSLIWADILQRKIEEFSADDDFFFLGGNSLSAIQLSLKILNQLHVNLDIQTIFDHSTISKLVTYIKKTKSIKREQTALHEICRIDGNTKLFLIHPGSGMAYIYNSLAPYVKNMTIYGISNPHFLNLRNSFVNLEEMARFYLSLIKKIQGTGPYCIGGFSFGGNVAVEIAKQLQENGDTVSKLLLIDSYRIIKTHGSLTSDQPAEDHEKIKENIVYSVALNENHHYTSVNFDSCDIMLIRALLESSSNIGDHGWSRFLRSKSEMQIKNFQCVHENLFKQPHLKKLAKIINDFMDEN